MRLHMKYQQASGKFVSLYISDPNVNSPRDGTEEIFNLAHDMFISSNQSQIDIEIYDVFIEPMILTYKGDGFVIWKRPS